MLFRLITLAGHCRSARTLWFVILTSYCLVSLADPLHAQTNSVYDVLIKNGRVVDGCGGPWFVADIAVKQGRIVRIGRLGDTFARRTFDASGLIVAPGFVDMMGQTASPFLRHSNAGLNLLSQGITTILAGEGVSAAPLSAAEARTNGWRTMHEYLDLLDQHGMPMNVAQTVGHTQIRRLVLGDLDRAPTPAELDQMRGMVAEAMEAGAIGLSTALIYPPAVYAPTEEIGQLCQVAGQYGGHYYTHMRNEGDRLIEAIDEALSIGAAADTPVHIFHLKAAGKANWPKMDLAIARIKTARDVGQEVDADIYPYINNGLDLESFIHPKHFAKGELEFRRQLSSPVDRTLISQEMEEGEGWENWFRHCDRDWNKVVLSHIQAHAYRQFNGKSLGEIARAVHKDPWTVFFDVVRDGAFALPQSMSEPNVIKALKEDFVSVCTDVGPAADSSIAGHPRAYGSFPRVLGHYVRDLGVLSLERAVSKMSALAADQIMAFDRGRIAIGQAADVIVFDFNTIQDRATFAKPDTESIGMKLVLVNGQVVWDQGKFSGALPGKVLRGPGYRGRAE
jgi:N-acyl-D-amino-acid deacylase